MGCARGNPGCRAPPREPKTPLPAAARGARKEKQPQPVAGAVEPGLLTPAGYTHTICIVDPRVKYLRARVSGQRVITYIDGYNLYHGLLAAGIRSSRWLDLPMLGQSLLKPDQDLELTRYFTTRVRGNPGKAGRQSSFIDALVTRGGIEIDFGHFLSKPVTCRRCGSTWQKNEEKKTDVNIAVRLLDDAYDDRFDLAVVISGDSDLVPPIEAVRRRFPSKRLLVAFPPKRHSSELRRVADAAFTISDRKIRASRLPPTIETATGVTLTAPPGWLPSE